mmetsp:Transcript_14661/g.34471  ORF Transcript_14661/g.34471 Transcript_14661/m.34471 type:complete len:107 (+) Transcript_14661:133-453(+)
MFQLWTTRWPSHVLQRTDHPSAQQVKNTCLPIERYSWLCDDSAYTTWTPQDTERQAKEANDARNMAAAEREQGGEEEGSKEEGSEDKEGSAEGDNNAEAKVTQDNK